MEISNFMSLEYFSALPHTTHPHQQINTCTAIYVHSRTWGSWITICQDTISMQDQLLKHQIPARDV